MNKIQPSRQRRHPRERGVSLLEVLITILIMSFGLLGIAGLTATSTQIAKTSQFKSVTLQLANEYAELMRGNTQAVADGNYNKTDTYVDKDASDTETVPACAIADDCTPAEIAAIDQAEWINHLRQRLPGGDAYVQYNDGELTADLWVMWQEPGMNVGSETLSVSDGGNPCPADALSGYAGNPPVCFYYRVSL